MASHAVRAFAHPTLVCDLGSAGEGGRTVAIIEGNLG
jgi:hypothetical protein